MAIDPQIALQVKPLEIDPAKSYAAGINIAGAQVDAQNKSRMFAARQAYAANADKFTSIDPNTKQPVIDYAKMGTVMHGAGFDDLLPEITKPLVDQISTNLSNATSAQDLQNKQVKAGTDLAQHAALMYKAARDRGDTNGALQILQQYPQIATKTVGANNLNPMNMPPSVDTENIDASLKDADKWSAAVNQASMSEQDQQNMKNANKYANIASSAQYKDGTDASAKAITYNTLSARYGQAISKIDSTNIPAGQWGSTAWAEALGISQSDINQMLAQYNAENGTALTMASGKDAMRSAFDWAQRKNAALGQGADAAAKELSKASGAKPVDTKVAPPAQAPAPVANQVPAGTKIVNNQADYDALPKNAHYYSTADKKLHTKK